MTPKTPIDSAPLRISNHIALLFASNPKLLGKFYVTANGERYTLGYGKDGHIIFVSAIAHSQDRLVMATARSDLAASEGKTALVSYPAALELYRKIILESPAFDKLPIPPPASVGQFPLST